MNYFLSRYKKMGHEFDPNKIKLMPSIRINNLKIDEKTLLKRLRNNEIELKKISFLKYGYYVDADFSLGSTPEYLFGYYYMQEAASQIVAEVLDPKEDEVILDMCAAPGSKTTHLSQLMNNNGTIIALDSNMNRIQALNNNIERLGCTNIIVYRKDAKFADDLEISFDKILLDAPCSGNFATDPEWFEKRDLEGIKNNSIEQKKLISTAAKILKKGGTLIYSTCTLEPEENEYVVEYAIENLGLVLEPIKLNVGERGTTEKTRLCKRFWPDTSGTQGFFIAKLRKI
jgi:NOL1/NOP2/sun family putative RNA methylase